VDIMRASHIASVAALLGVTASLSTGCTDAAAPMPTTGAIGITAATTGVDLDADGYDVSVDGGARRAIGTNGTMAISGLPPGDHVVRLDGVAANCTVRGSNPVQVSVAAGAMAEVPFALACTAPVTRLVFASVSAGHSSSCGVTTDGAAYCWGQNYTGQFGDGTTRATSSSPVPAAAGLRFATVSAGSDFACGVTIDGAGYCWGSNGLGELGGGTSQSGSTTPVAVTGGLSFTAVAAAYAHTCGVTGTEEASCWGWNPFGQLGDGTTANRSTPGLVSGGLRFTMVSTGTYHTCAVTPSAAAYCWGGNGGRLGDGTTNQSPVPTPVAGGLSFSGVAVAERHSCGVTTDGAPYCWGWNDDGQLGDGTTLQRTTPVPVAGGLVLRAVSAGRSHTCGVTTSGAVYCWGGNADGQLGNGTTTSSLTPVQVVP